MSHEIPFGGRNCPVSKAVLDKSPELQTALGVHRTITKALAEAVPAKPAKRIRQDSKPIMNKLETEWLNFIRKVNPHIRIHAQDKTYKLANGLRYTPDFTALTRDQNDQTIETAWEVKGKWVDGDSFPKLKMAAAVWPEICWILVWKQDGVWKEQTILP